MKLKSGIVMEKTGDEYIVVATGEAAKSFNGIIRNNKTANFVFEQLKEDKTEKELVDALLERYDVSREKAQALIQRVYVDGDSNIEIVFRYRDEYKELCTYLEGRNADA